MVALSRHALRAARTVDAVPRPPHFRSAHNDADTALRRHCRHQAERALAVAEYAALLPAERQTRASVLRSVIASIEARALQTRSALQALGYGAQAADVQAAAGERAA